MKRYRLILTVTFLLFLAGGAQANAGTPLMWLTMGHLLIGNWFIGCLEAMILKRVYHVNYARTASVMVMANYTSAFVGYFILAFGVVPSFNRPMIEQFFLVLWTTLGLFLVLTLLIELPFVRYIFKSEQLGWKQTLVGLLIIHVVSYSFMTSLYFYVSDFSLYLRTKAVPIERLDLPNDVLFVYEDRDANQLIIENFRRDERWALHADRGASMSYVREEVETGSDVDIYYFEIRRLNRPHIKIPIDEQRIRFGYGGRFISTHGYTSGNLAVGRGTDSDFTARGFMPLQVRNKVDRDLSYGLAGESVITPWGVIFNPIIISPDIVLFFCSRNGILALDMRTREIAKLRDGVTFAVIPREDFDAWLASREEEEEP